MIFSPASLYKSPSKMLEKLLHKNTLTSKPEKVESTGIGLKNLRERYRFFGKALPSISQTEAFYEVRLPFVTPIDTDR